MKKPNYKLHLKICFGETPYLGPGRVALLEGIEKEGSISEAAKSLGMSYRKAWQLVKNMNDLSSEPLVEKKLGGAKGGGTKLTKAGRAAIRKFRLLQEKVESFARKHGDNIGFKE